MGEETPTIFEWGGGRAVFERWLNTFYDLVEGDDLLAPVFGGKVTEEHGGYRRMLARHRGLAITPEQRLRFVTLLSRAADEADLPADPEFRAAIVGYAEWGSRLAVHNSQPGAEVVPEAPVPRWGWGVAPPYEP